MWSAFGPWRPTYCLLPMRVAFACSIHSLLCWCKRNLMIPWPCFSSPIAVVARAPRKAMGSSSSAVTPVSASKGGSKKGKHVGGNTMKMWPTPSWQKDLKAFLDVSSPTSSASSRTEGDEAQASSMDDLVPKSQGSSTSSSPSPVTTPRGTSSGLRHAHFEEDSDDDDWRSNKSTAWSD